MIVLWFIVIFQRSSQNKNKRKGEKPLPSQPQTAEGGYVNGFMSLRRLNGQFQRVKADSAQSWGEKKKELFSFFAMLCWAFTDSYVKRVAQFPKKKELSVDRWYWRDIGAYYLYLSPQNKKNSIFIDHNQLSLQFSKQNCSFSTQDLIL